MSQWVKTKEPDVLVGRHPDRHARELFDRHQSAILYSSYLESKKLNLGFVKTKIMTQLLKNREKKLAEDNVKVRPFSIALKYWDEAETNFDEKDIVEEDLKADNLWKANLLSEFTYNKKKELFNALQLQQSSVADKDEQKPFVNDWMNDYEIFDDSEFDTHSQFGTPDPSVPVSKIPCYGCGALLHCADTGLPGYLPSELFKGKKADVLKVKL